MGAHPKNKITRVEQGKRRAGNTPKLAKNKAHAAVPAHKKTLFGKFLTAVAGAITKPAIRGKKAAKNEADKLARQAARKAAKTPAKSEVKADIAVETTAVKAPAKKAAPKAAKKATAKKSE